MALPSNALEPVGAPAPKPPVVRLKVEWHDAAGHGHVEYLDISDGQLPVFLEVWIKGHKVYGLTADAEALRFYQ